VSGLNESCLQKIFVCGVCRRKIYTPLQIWAEAEEMGDCEENRSSILVLPHMCVQEINSGLSARTSHIHSHPCVGAMIFEYKQASRA
jgi:hypothetical protein